MGVEEIHGGEFVLFLLLLREESFFEKVERHVGFFKLEMIDHTDDFFATCTPGFVFIVVPSPTSARVFLDTCHVS